MIINNIIIKKFVCQKTIRENQYYPWFHFISVNGYLFFPVRICRHDFEFAFLRLVPRSGRWLHDRQYVHPK